MRKDLLAASQPLGVLQRFWWRDHLERVEPLLSPAETVRLLAPGRWHHHRSLAVLTASRLLLVRREPRDPVADYAVFVLRDIICLTAHPSSPTGATFQIVTDGDLVDFTVDRHGAELEQAMRLAMP